MSGSKEFAQRLFGANMGFNYNPRSNDSFGQQWLEQSVIRPQEQYNRSYQNGVNSAASRAGNYNGYADGYQRFGVPQAMARDSYIRGQESGIRNHYYNAGRYDTEAALGGGYGYQSGGQHAPRYQDNGRQQYRDDLPHGPNGSHPQSRGGEMTRSMQPNQTYDYVIHSGNKQYTVYNDQPLTQAQQDEIAGALHFIDKQHIRGGKRTEELGALQHAFANGLSPNALVATMIVRRPAFMYISCWWLRSVEAIRPW